jgi:hypothetical protein
VTCVGAYNGEVNALHELSHLLLASAPPRHGNATHAASATNLKGLVGPYFNTIAGHVRQRATGRGLSELRGHY